MTSPIMVGLDIGGTKVDAVAIEEDGRIIQRLRMPTGFGHEAVLDANLTTYEFAITADGQPI